MVLGEPDRDELYAGIERESEQLVRQVQVTIRNSGWLADGEGTFHDTVVNRPIVPIPLGDESAG